MQEAAAWMYQADTAVIPVMPLSPHVHLVGALTAEAPKPLFEPFKSICDSAQGSSLVFVSMGTTAVPGEG